MILNRSSITGKFVTKEYAKRNPKTTVSEKVKEEPKDSGVDKNKK